MRSSWAGLIAGCASMLALSGSAAGQPEQPSEEEPVGEPPAEEPPADQPAAESAEESPEVAAGVESSGLTVHVITTRNTYETIGFDIFDVSTQQVVASGRSVDEAAGRTPPSFELPTGVYKIVRSGEPFATRVDFATVRVDGPTDYVIVVDAETGAFRGGGIVSGELPEGRKIAGIRLALNVGGNIELNQQRKIVGTTNGNSGQVGLFGNFSLVLDRNNHFLKVDSQLHLTVRNPETADSFSTSDFFQGSGLYAFNINNPYVGPYARVAFQTKVFPGYLYLKEDEMATGAVNVHRLDGSVDTFEFGGEANSDNLRIEIAEAFAPFVLQEEVGANLKAVDLDLRLLQLSVATRLGFGLRQGITNGLLVVEGSERGTPVELFERDNYFTLGPVAGASATVTFARWLFGSGEFGMMLPLRDTDRAGDNLARRLLLDLSATGGLKFPSLSFFYGSIDYTLRLQREGYLTDDTQFAHAVMARANLQLF
jgi:hypothetical protein